MHCNAQTKGRHKKNAMKHDTPGPSYRCNFPQFSFLANKASKKYVGEKIKDAESHEKLWEREMKEDDQPVTLVTG